MSTQNAKSTLKILGILSIIFAIFGIILGIGFLAGGDMFTKSLVKSGEATDEAFAMSGIMYAMGALVVIASIVDLLLGIFSVRASGDFSKAKPAYTLSIIAIIFTIITGIVNFASGATATAIIDLVVSLVFGVCIMLAAKTAKDNA